jgi:arginine utilization protein RocB
MLQQEIQDPGLRRDLEDEAWGFGRGMADMKAGLAINLHTLLTRKAGEAGVLFLAVPDEERMSSGAIQAVPLLLGLRERFGLDYRLLVLTEPETTNGEDLGVVRVTGGGTGKILPVVLAKGVLTHAAHILDGLNSAFMLAEIVRSVELDTGLVSGDKGQFVQPPATQIMRDLKSGYDVSVPEYSAACFNLMFFPTRSPLSLLEDLRGICARAAHRVVRRYHEAFDAMVGMGAMAGTARQQFAPEVLTLGELEQRLGRAPDFEAFRQATLGRAPGRGALRALRPAGRQHPVPQGHGRAGRLPRAGGGGRDLSALLPGCEQHGHRQGRRTIPGGTGRAPAHPIRQPPGIPAVPRQYYRPELHLLSGSQSGALPA